MCLLCLGVSPPSSFCAFGFEAGFYFTGAPVELPARSLVLF